jgi:large subunit ribosomal protein L13
MKDTYLAKPGQTSSKWYIIDAAGVPLGRTAAKAASILRGKHRPEFTPNVDLGDHVIVINAGEAVLTGNKLENKIYYRHTGYIGGLKAVPYGKLMAENPEKAMMLAVKGMLPKNSLGRKMLTKIRVYKDAEHENQAQKPEVYNG